MHKKFPICGVHGFFIISTAIVVQICCNAVELPETKILLENYLIIDGLCTTIGVQLLGETDSLIAFGGSFMGTEKKGNQQNTGRDSAGSSSTNTCSKRTAEKGDDMIRRIRNARAALHDAIQRAGDKPLSECSEVLRLSRELDELIVEMHGSWEKK